jgi:hypothetical protein
LVENASGLSSFRASNWGSIGGVLESWGPPPGEL